MSRAMLGAVVASGLVGLAANMQPELAGFIAGPPAHPRFHVGLRVMEDWLLEDDGFGLRLLLRQFRATL